MDPLCGKKSSLTDGDYLKQDYSKAPSEDAQKISISFYEMKQFVLSSCVKTQGYNVGSINMSISVCFKF